MTRTRKTIRAEVDGFLTRMGFGDGTWDWATKSPEVVVLINGRITRFKFTTRMTRFEFGLQLGIIAGLSKGAGLKPRRLNGAAHAATPTFHEAQHSFPQMAG